MDSKRRILGVFAPGSTTTWGQCPAAWPRRRPSETPHSQPVSGSRHTICMGRSGSCTAPRSVRRIPLPAISCTKVREMRDSIWTASPFRGLKLSPLGLAAERSGRAGPYVWDCPSAWAHNRQDYCRQGARPSCAARVSSWFWYSAARSNQPVKHRELHAHAQGRAASTDPLLRSWRMNSWTCSRRSGSGRGPLLTMKW
jgi:hypothetical protein